MKKQNLDWESKAQYSSSQGCVVLTKLFNISGHWFPQVKNKELVLGSLKAAFKFKWNTKPESCTMPRSFHYEDQLVLQSSVKIILVLCISDAYIMVSEGFLYSQGLIIRNWFSNKNIVETFLHDTRSVLWHLLRWPGDLCYGRLLMLVLLESCSLLYWVAKE